MKEYLPPPSHVNYRNLRHKNRDGRQNPYTVTDEITEMQNEEKAIYLQKLKFDDGRTELRLAYWIIGSKGKRMSGKWTYGQSATMLPREILESIIEKAITKGWISKKCGEKNETNKKKKPSIPAGH